MKRKIELLMGLCVILCAFVLARKGAVFVQSEQAKSAPVCIVVDSVMVVMIREKSASMTHWKKTSIFRLH